MAEERKKTLSSTGAVTTSRSDSTVVINQKEIEAGVKSVPVPMAAVGPRVLQMDSDAKGPQASLVGVGDLSQYPDPLATEPEPKARGDGMQHPRRRELSELVDLFNHAMRVHKVPGDVERCIRMQSLLGPMAQKGALARAQLILLPIEDRTGATLVAGLVDVEQRSVELRTRGNLMAEAAEKKQLVTIENQGFERAIAAAEAFLLTEDFKVRRATRIEDQKRDQRPTPSPAKTDGKGVLVAVIGLAVVLLGGLVLLLK